MGNTQEGSVLIDHEGVAQVVYISTQNPRSISSIPALTGLYCRYN